MTIEEIKNLRELVDIMLDKCVLTDSRIKIWRRLKEVCDLAIKALEQEPCDSCETGNPCLYCKYEFEPQERSDEEI